MMFTHCKTSSSPSPPLSRSVVLFPSALFFGQGFPSPTPSHPFPSPPSLLVVPLTFALLIFFVVFSRANAGNGFADELAQITEESMLMMQRNVFERLRPLECSPVHSATMHSSQQSAGAGYGIAGDASGSSGGSRSSGIGGGSGNGKRSMKGGRSSGAGRGGAAADGGASAGSAEAGRDSKPAISFACLIGMAILESSKQRLTVSEVYDWMKRAFPYFSSPQAGTGWKNSVRHNLSLNKHFVKQVRNDPESGGKGSYWCIRAESLPIMEAAIRKQHTSLSKVQTPNPSPSSSSGASTVPASKAAAASPAAAAGAAQVSDPTHAAYKAAHRPRPTAPRNTPARSLRRQHTFDLRETLMGSSPTTETRDAASALFQMVGQSKPSQSFPSLAQGKARAWSANPTATARIVAAPRPPASAQPIRGSYNPNVYKQGRRREVSKSESDTMDFATPEPLQKQVQMQQAAATSRWGQQQQQQQQHATATPAPAMPNQAQKVFTFSSPMSFSGETRYTPEFAARPRSDSIESMKLVEASKSPESIRRRLAPLASPLDEARDGNQSDGGMDCDSDDDQTVAAAGLLWLAQPN